MLNDQELKDRINHYKGWKIRRLEVITDTSDPMRIYRGNVIFINDNYFLVQGFMREPRFGIDDQPKYWVLSTIDLNNGDHKILKTPFQEEFHVHIGILKIRCYRDVQKESDVLRLTQGDHRFMQGIDVKDSKENNVRIIDFIKGTTFFRYIPGIEKNHEAYFFEDFPRILLNLKDSIEAIRKLHEHGFCHGDIRNDHIIIDSVSGKYRWIDFDLKEDVTDFDLWSLGNILNYATGKGIITFKSVLQGKEFSEKTKKNIVPEDGSAFYAYRLMNLQKIYPYIPDKLNDILMHFTIKPQKYYLNMDMLLDDYYDLLASIT